MSKTINGIIYEENFFRQEMLEGLDLLSVSFKLKAIRGIKGVTSVTAVDEDSNKQAMVLGAEYTDGDDWESRSTILQGYLPDGRQVDLVKHENRSGRPLSKPLSYNITIWDHDKKTYLENWNQIRGLDDIFENNIGIALEGRVSTN